MLTRLQLKSMFSEMEELELGYCKPSKPNPKGRKGPTTKPSQERLREHISRLIPEDDPDEFEVPIKRIRRRKGPTSSSVDVSNIYSSFLLCDSQIQMKKATALDSENSSETALDRNNHEDSTSTEVTNSSVCLPLETLESQIPLPSQNSERTSEQKGSHTEFDKKVNELLTHNGFSLCRSYSKNYIDKEIILNFKNSKLLGSDKLDYIHKRINEDFVNIVNGLCSKADFPEGVFTYTQQRKALVEESLIKDNVYDPYFRYKSLGKDRFEKCMGVLIPDKTNVEGFDTSQYWLRPRNPRNKLK